MEFSKNCEFFQAAVLWTLKGLWILRDRKKALKQCGWRGQNLKYTVFTCFSLKFSPDFQPFNFSNRRNVYPFISLINSVLQIVTIVFLLMICNIHTRRHALYSISYFILISNLFFSGMFDFYYLCPISCCRCIF